MSLQEQRVLAGIEEWGRGKVVPPTRAEIEEWWYGMLKPRDHKQLAQMLKLTSEKLSQWNSDDLEKVKTYLVKREVWT